MTRRIGIALIIALVATVPLAAAPPQDQWVVVVPPGLRAAVEPLARHRRAEGFAVVEVSSTDSVGPERLRDHLARLCRDFPGPTSILLAGSLDQVPPLSGTAGRMKGEPSDNGYGLPGDDLLPTVAVGRLPARTAEELRAMVAKVLAQEQDRRPGAWRRRLTVLAGAPEFHPLVDAAVERLAIAQLARIDPSWSGRALYHNPQSRFYLPDELCHDRARAYVEEGQALTLYLGHSNAPGFYANRARYLDRDDWAQLAIRQGPGLFATFGCLGCQLKGPDGEGYGVAAIRNPRGPAAVVGSHGICFAAMVKLASEAFTESLLGPKPPERLGAAWLALKRGLAKGRIDPLTYRLLDAADGDPKVPQDAQRREHLEMFLLLGDPALRLPRIPDDITFEVIGDARPGGQLRVTGQAPARLEGATVRLTAERPRESEPAEPIVVPPTGPERRNVLVERHERANVFVVAEAGTTVREGRFEAVLELPRALPWRRVTVRVAAATARDEALRCRVLEVPERPAP